MENEQLQKAQLKTSMTNKKADSSKRWWRSKTIWFNVLATIAGGLAATIEIATDIAPILQPMLTPSTFGTVTAVIGVGNILLRHHTHKPIKGGVGGKSGRGGRKKVGIAND